LQEDRRALVNSPQLSYRRILKTWWPLAASWFLMGIELPALSAVVARLPNPEISLAAYGGVVFPLALIIEAPIIMLLAASTALSKDWASYILIRQFMMWSGGLLTALHILIAFTPLYYVVVEGIIGAPPVIVEPARIGLMIMTPWTWSIAYRRFNQGVLIRFGHSRLIGVGTLVRLAADLLVLGLGYKIGTIPGIVVATSAVAAGVICEAIYVGIVVRPVVNGPLTHAVPVSPALTWKAFREFYTPLAITSLLMLLANPIGSAAISRMPQPLNSLAVWPVVTGLIFMLRSMGIAFNEVVVALLDEPKSSPSLQRFAWILSGVTTLILLLVVATPLSRIWFENVSGLTPALAGLAVIGLWLALPLPALNTMQSWYQGMILFGRQTRGITESVVIYLATSALVFGVGAAMGRTIGLYVGLLGLTASVLTQTGWLWWRSREVHGVLNQRDLAQPLPAADSISIA
jgi:hypothetical protein